MSPVKHRHASSFSGSYLPDDVQLLLKRIDVVPTPVDLKEALIQTGERHYSEMISEEQVPDERYMDMFRLACQNGVPRLAREIVVLADRIEAHMGAGQPVTLCSLVRAGLPYGVLLQRALRRRGVDVVHYGISIIRDKGLDAAAVAHVLSRRPESSVIFVDGWTGKGAISRELNASWRALTGLEPCLAVMTDPCGAAHLYASQDDWLIPSGILGANVSGLISRSILRPDLMGPGDFHGCVTVEQLAHLDVTRSFVDAVDVGVRLAIQTPAGAAFGDALVAPAVQREAALQTVAAVAQAFDITNENRIKPGIAEATRAILRRKPHKVLVRTLDPDPDLAALLHLCQKCGVPAVQAPELTGPYRAITIIEKAGP